jgi:hypothetical protein
LAVDFFAAVFLAVDRLAGDLLLGAVMRCASSEQSRWNHPSLQTNLTVSDARRQYGAPTSFVATATRRRHATRVIVVLIARNPLRRRCFRCVINTQWRRSTPLTGSKKFCLVTRTYLHTSRYGGMSAQLTRAVHVAIVPPVGFATTVKVPS